MANNKNEQVEVQEISKAEKFVQENLKRILMAMVALVVIILAYVAISGMGESKNEKALKSDALMEAQFAFEAEQYETALEGFESVISEYGSTKVGNMCKAYAGLCQKELGNLEEAISYLKEFDGSDNIIAPAILSALGDCQVSLENADYSAAAKNFEKAANKANNQDFSPLYLKKAGLAYEKAGDNKKALSCYEIIKKSYAETEIGQTIDKYIARVQ